MRIKVFQVDPEKDNNNTTFDSYENVIERVGRIDPSIYKCVYDGNIDASSLEEAYRILNTNHPVGYNGHSLSVSDIVNVDNKNYYCDTFGFKELSDFDISEATQIKGHRMLVVEPHKAPYEMVIPDGLEALQQAVGGYIECTYPFDDSVFVIGNEEAKLIGLEGNRRINGEVYAGTILIAADDGFGGTTDLSESQIKHYSKMFEIPEEISPQEVKDSIWYMITGFDSFS